MSLSLQYQAVRKASETICRPLQTEDYVVQPIGDTSPPKWHLGHTTWFWETFVLTKYKPGYQVFHPDYNFVFNSYYETIGARVIRTNRGNLSRPSVREVYQYREYVDRAMIELLSSALDVSDHLSSGKGSDGEFRQTILLGLNHEQQHQELLFSDIKYILGHNPLFPAWSDQDMSSVHAAAVHAAADHAAIDDAATIHAASGHIAETASGHITDTGSGTKNSEKGNENVDALKETEQKEKFIRIAAGMFEIGFSGEGFCFDNEQARHKVYLDDFSIATSLVTNAQYISFIQAGGYTDFRYWHAEGWDWVKNQHISAPLYWHFIEGEWHCYTLRGLRPVAMDESLCHISYYEAAAYAAWVGMRLPTEWEWEASAGKFNWGKRWEWTGSAYLPYPGFKRAEGAIGEYNGKFMISQMVLRGASVATPPGHSRVTYRNFFHPPSRWQFTGIRLAV